MFFYRLCINIYNQKVNEILDDLTNGELIDFDVKQTGKE